MVYVFFVLVVTQYLQVGLETTVSIAGFSQALDLSPQPSSATCSASRCSLPSW